MIDWDNTDSEIWKLAETVAIMTNGGDWKKEYTLGQKRGWYLKAVNFMKVIKQV